MTQPPRTTESISRDNAAIRDIMHSIRELTVPDRATLAVGLIGHLATMMNRSQMTKLMDQLREEAERVQDVPPARQRDNEQRGGADNDATAARSAAGGGNRPDERTDLRAAGPSARDGAVGQAGRGEFRARKIV